MASFVHCMMCFQLPKADLKFYITSCGHIACYNCINNGCWSIQCKICHKENIRVLEINRSMPPQLADMFSPMADGLDKMLKEISMVLEFQAGHRNMMVKNLQQRVSTLPKLQEFCQGEVKKKEQYKAQMMKLAEYKKWADKEIRQLREKVQMAARSMPQEREMAPPGDTTMNLANLTHDPFRTPACGNKNNRSFVTSTPFLPRTSNGDHTNQTMNSTTENHTTVNSSLSFAAATGLTRMSTDTSGEVSRLEMEAVNLCSSPKNVKEASNGKGLSNTFNGTTKHSTQRTFKTPAVKKTKLDMMSKTMPLPLK